MSKSWLDEFYPVTAEEFGSKMKKNKNDIQVEIEAIKLSLRKWQGLLSKNLKKYGLKSDGSKVTDNNNCVIIYISASSCSLCELYFSMSDSCDKCPLSKHLGYTCDYSNGVEPSVYNRSIEDPSIMVDLLKEMLKEREEEIESKRLSKTEF